MLKVTHQTAAPGLRVMSTIALFSHFVRPFVKRFVLCYQTVCLSGPVCPVGDVGVLWPNGWMDQDATWYRGRPRPKSYCVRWGPSSPTEWGTAAHCFSAHVSCGQTVAHLSNC